MNEKDEAAHVYGSATGGNVPYDFGRNEKDEAGRLRFHHERDGGWYAHRDPNPGCVECIITQRDQGLAEVERLRAALEKAEPLIKMVAGIPDGDIEAAPRWLAEMRHHARNWLKLPALADNTREASDG